MRLLRVVAGCGLGLIVLGGCARTDEDQAKAPPNSPSSPTTQPTDINSPTTEPTASKLLIGGSAQWFPPARLRLSIKDGNLVARLYSDDPMGAFTGPQTANSYDLRMVMPGIHDIGQINGAQWTNQSSSMERQDTPFGISLNHQQDVLQPMNVTMLFEGQGSDIRVTISGTFCKFHISDDTPNPAPTIVPVMGVLHATVPTER